jgi:hypothetical protein
MTEYLYSYEVESVHKFNLGEFTLTSRSSYNFRRKPAILELAKECAEDFYKNRDGCVHKSWTDGGYITIIVYEDEHTSHRCLVGVEFEPIFCARW